MAKVLMFHRVLPQKHISSPNAYSDFGTLLSQEYFEKVLSFLNQQEFQFVTVDELTRRNLKKENTDKLIVLTFDDGYSDNYKYAFPSLKNFQATATFFPTVNPCRDNSVLPLDIYYQCVDELDLVSDKRIELIKGERKKEFYWLEPNKQLEYLKSSFQKIPEKKNYKVSYLSEAQLKEISSEGFEIGSHGTTHSLFTASYMDESALMIELKASKHWLEQITGKPVTSFCFPAGRYNSWHIQLVKEAGYKSVCLVKKETLENFPAYDRIFVKPDSLEDLKLELFKK